MSILLKFVIGIVLVVVAVWLWRQRVRPSSRPAFARTESDNSAELMFQQAMAYRRGEQLDIDFQTARQLLRRAAEMHHVQAQFEYGVMLDRGLGGERDPVKGWQWILHAARMGSVQACLMLGKHYLSGDRGEKNPQLAEQYLRSAAELGVAEAQTLLGLLYRDSEPPLENPEKAVEWLTKAVAQRYPGAFHPLSEFYRIGVAVPQDIKMSDELLRQAAEFGDAEAQLKIARYYLTGAFGHAFAQDYRAALDWFRRAASRGSAEAEFEVGVRYEQNEGVDAPDMSRAVASYLKAAEAGYAPAQYRIGQMCLYGQGLNQNLREAKRWFDAAAAQGHADAARQALKLQAQVSDEPVLPAPDQDDHASEPEWKG